MFEPFNQRAPELGNQYADDHLLRSALRRLLPPDALRESEPSFLELGELSGGPLYRLQLADRLNEPRLVSWGPWGERVEQVELTPLWREAERLAAEKGIVATAYEGRFGRFDRLVQVALAYLFHPSSDVYTCPLAMTDGAARTLVKAGNRALSDRALPHLLSRDPREFWTSGQWMTESTGGSDVGTSETIAGKGEDGRWRLWGRKWFTSAVSSPMALTLARPEGNGPGGDGLALFYLELRDPDGRMNGIRVNRLKEKLGTRKLPTAELSLEGTLAEPVMELSHGVRSIVPMLQVTRTWNSVTSASFMRRGLALAEDYGQKRVAFGAPIAEQPLHADTLEGLQAEHAGALLLCLALAEVMGKEEKGEASDAEKLLFRVLTSLTKLTTGKQAVEVTAEVAEVFAGAGYVEDTGIPLLVRDAHVLPIWEGTTNVLSLDALKPLAKGPALEVVRARVAASAGAARDGRLAAAGRRAVAAADHAAAWLSVASAAGKPAMEAGARRLALTLGRSLELALLVEQAQWALDAEGDGRFVPLALRLARSAVDLVRDDERPASA